jgi:hypothetical protein
MHDQMEWWRHLEHKLKVEGFEECRDAPRKAERRSGEGAPLCLTSTCRGEPEFRAFTRGNEFMGFLVCPICGGVWNTTTHERFH